MIEVTVHKHPATLAVRCPWLRRVALAAAALDPIAGRASRGGEVGLVLVNSEEMARVNAAHLGHAGPTDVITFDYADGPPEMARLCGELLLCPEVAARQAREFRTTMAREMVRYVVHGLLHLCGYDDRSAADRRVMKRCENRLVRVVTERVDCDERRSGCPA